MNRFLLLYILLLCLCACKNGQRQQVRYVSDGNRIDSISYTGKEYGTNFGPTRIKEGMVPNEECAARIAYEYVSAVFGEGCANKEQPYSISLINDQVWDIAGCPPKGEGGAFHIAIEKATGKVQYIMHGK